MKNILKIILVGVLTTFLRIMEQMLIPSGEQTVLKSSIFVNNGSMPFMFTIYGIFAYSLISSLFLIIRSQIKGSKIIQGLKYGIACSFIWSIYLLEPLPHVVPVDKITYPIADSLALILMGILSGALFGKQGKVLSSKAGIKELMPLITITVCFILGRLFQYNILSIYSSYDTKTNQTIIWCIVTGFIIACVMIWLNKCVYTKQKNIILNTLIVGGLIFGLNLTLFNFFMPLVFDADIKDLLLRTAIDIIAVTIGCLALNCNKTHNGVYL